MNRRTKYLLIVLISFLLTTFARADEVSMDEFVAWLNDPVNKSEIRFLKKSTITANTHAQLIKVYNTIIVRGGTYDRDYVRRYPGCDVMRQWSYGRILELKKGSTVARVQFRQPYRNKIIEQYVHISQLPRLQDLKKRLAK